MKRTLYLLILAISTVLLNSCQQEADSRVNDTDSTSTRIVTLVNAEELMSATNPFLFTYIIHCMKKPLTVIPTPVDWIR